MNDSIPGITIRAATPEDRERWRVLRTELWPEASVAEHEQEITAQLDLSETGRAATRIAVNAVGEPLGFVELTLRSHADGCESSPVAYLEGWYVRTDQRGRGIGAALVRAAEAWAREHGCSEFASDVVLGNDLGLAAHEAVGFEETERVILLRKRIPAERPNSTATPR